MRSRALVLLVLTFLGTSLLATSTAAAAGGPPDVRSEVKKIIRDCARDDDLDRHYSLRALRRALRVLPDDVREYTGCERAIRRAIKRARFLKYLPEAKKALRDCERDGHLDRDYSLPALRVALRLVDSRRCERVIERAIRRAEQKLFREVDRIFRDCARDDDLDRRYSLQALRLALRYLPDDLRDYTGCERAIRRAIRRAKDHDHGGHHHGGHHQHGHRQKAARAT
jgi:uncharacterized protein (DUF2236 family)